MRAAIPSPVHTYHLLYTLPYTLLYTHTISHTHTIVSVSYGVGCAQYASLEDTWAHTDDSTTSEIARLTSEHKHLKRAAARVPVLEEQVSDLGRLWPSLAFSPRRTPLH